MTFLNILKFLVIVVITVLWTVVIAIVEIGTYPTTLLEIFEFLTVGMAAIMASSTILILVVFSTAVLFY